MQEPFIRLWCDRCDLEGRIRQPGETTEITIDGVRHELELCEECRQWYAALVEPVRQLLRKYGRAARGAAPAPRPGTIPKSTVGTPASRARPNSDGRYECPVPDCETRGPFDNRRALGQHFRVHPELLDTCPKCKAKVGNLYQHMMYRHRHNK